VNSGATARWFDLKRKRPRPSDGRGLLRFKDRQTLHASLFTIHY